MRDWSSGVDFMCSNAAFAAAVRRAFAPAARAQAVRRFSQSAAADAALCVVSAP